MSAFLQEFTKRRTNTNYNTRDPLALIYNEGLWRLNNVSPLYKLQYLPVNLKKYASKIKQSVVSTVQISSAKYMVDIEELPTLKYSDDDAHGLNITVSSSTETTGNVKTIYAAVLLSWGVSENVERTIHLPYMLERGEQRVGNAVKSTLQTLFDCNIRQISFTQAQLLQIGFNFLETDIFRGIDSLSLVYKTPDADIKDKLTFSFDVKDVHLIWNRIKDVPDHMDLVEVAYKILQNQIFDMIELDVTVCDLCEINLPKAEVKSNGAVKMQTPEIVNCVLTVLNTISNYKSK